MGPRMITTTTEGAPMSTKNSAARAALAACLLCLAAFPAFASNTLKGVTHSAAASGRVDITFEFAEPIGAVNAFTTDDPPRIAIDFPERVTMRTTPDAPRSTSASAAAAASCWQRRGVIE